MTIHGPDEFNDPAGFLLREKVAAASFVCAISAYGRSQLARVSTSEHWDKIEVAPLGVDAGIFAPRTFRAAPEPLEIACVGRLAPAKAQRVLIGALSRLVRQGRSIRVRFVGDGPDRRVLEKEAAALGLTGRIAFEGSVNHDRVRDIYRETDVFALASFAEGVPVVLMEAMAMEIPCVATWITGIPELIRSELDGLLVPPADEEALACAIARLQDDPALRERLGKAGRLRVIEKYDLGANVRRLAAIFEARLLPHQ
jgi:colanic acid/amylovoran biosynthesis glycosyltransferase